VKAVVRAGMEVSGVEVTKDGTIRVVTGSPDEAAISAGGENPWDKVTDLGAARKSKRAVKQ
jgi:hypothetical protein